MTRNANTIAAVTVDIGDPLPDIPRRANPSLEHPHQGYELVKSDDLPLVVIRAVGAAPSLTPEVPEVTALQPNYPNPFNPETWIPYHLANASDVQIIIYNAQGVVVRRLDLGHQQAGYYTSQSRAAYSDGTNNVGERVASGVYFYQLQADSVSLLRKMVILN